MWANNSINSSLFFLISAHVHLREHHFLYLLRANEKRSACSDRIQNTIRHQKRVIDMCFFTQYKQPPSSTIKQRNNRQKELRHNHLQRSFIEILNPLLKSYARSLPKWQTTASLRNRHSFEDHYLIEALASRTVTTLCKLDEWHFTDHCHRYWCHIKHSSYFSHTNLSDMSC